MGIKIGINGFGRIGRVIFRTCLQNPLLEVSAVNDPAIDNEYICYLMKFDSTHGKLQDEVTHKNTGEINVNGKPIKIFHEKLPELIPWQDAGVEYVIEASGMFTNVERASGHLSYAGVKRVLVTAPSVSAPMVIHTVNNEILRPEQKVLSCASSTLYCLAPIMKVLEDKFGVSEGFITSIHAMTPSLKPLDGLCVKGKHWRDHRSIHQNVIPAKTGACKALGKIIPQMRGKMSGIAFRVPIANVSVLDITVRLARSTNLDEIVKAVDEASNKTMKGVIKVSRDESVSSDFIGDSYSCTLDAGSCIQLSPEFYKLICWYENEYSYACRVIDSILFSEKQFSEVKAIENIKKLDVRTDNQFKSNMRIDLYQDAENSWGTKLEVRSNPCGQKTTAPARPSSLICSCKLNTTTWNDTISKHSDCYSKNSNFESYLELESRGEEDERNEQRLQNIKREFSKMMNFTEDILRKSSCSGISINTGPNKTGSIKSKLETCYKTNNNFQPTHGATKISIDGDINSVFSSSISSIEKPKQFTLPQQSASKTNKLKIDKDCFVPVTIRPSKVLAFQDKYKNTNQIKASASQDCKKQVTKTATALIDGFNQIIQNKYQKETISKSLSNKSKNFHTLIQQSDCFKTNKEKELPTDHLWKQSTLFDNETRIELSQFKRQDISLLDQKLKARNIELVERSKNESKYENRTASLIVKSKKENQILSSLSRYSGTDPVVIVSEESFRTASISNTVTTVSNRETFKGKQDLYDKLDSASITDSENSLKIRKKQSQVLNIRDLTNSLEDLERLDKICKIIEISDDLSDQLFSNLDDQDYADRNKKWSFRDLCERIKLDEFCNKVFGKS